MQRPAVLQVNQLGSWRNAITFDVDAFDERATLDAAEALARAIDPRGTIKLRIVATDHQPGNVLMTWDMHKGWTPWRDAP